MAGRRSAFLEFSIQRYPFPYYHTSYDTPDILNADLIVEALTISDFFIEILERDYVPSYRNLMQPWLTRHGLYFDQSVNPQHFQKLNNLAVFNIDGCRSVTELALLSELPFGLLHEYLEKFVKLDLIGKRPIDVELPAAKLAAGPTR